MDELKRELNEYPLRIRNILIKLIAAVIIGVACGLLGAAFNISVKFAQSTRNEHPWLLFFLPLAGLLITAIYKITRAEGEGTDSVVKAAQSGELKSMLLIPAIFAGTFLTHLTGGSAGREGAALQMGGQAGFYVSGLFRAGREFKRTCVIAGMAALFSALFGTPVAATVFAMEVVHVGLVVYSDFLPTFVASVTAYLISGALFEGDESFAVTSPELSFIILLKVLLLGAMCAVPTIMFCQSLHIGEHLIEKYLKNPWIRVVAGGIVIIAITLLYGSQRYSGTGMDVIAVAIEEGEALPWDWIMKILLTAITLGTGYRGGEVVPSLFIGATFGCVAGPLLGLPAGFSAAVGLTAVFCGCSNCMLATVFLCLELFGVGSLFQYAVAACAVNYILSGHVGFYRAQGLLVEDVDPNTIDHMRHPF